MLSKHPAHAQNLREVRQAVDHRVSLLASRLAADLSSASLLSQTYLRSHIQYLLALGLQEQAREIYLHTRSFTLKEVVRKLKFEGDIVGYIQRLSSAVFRFLTDTGKYYIATFAEQHLSSGYVLWASQELEEYAAIFRRYVFYNHSFRVVVDCLRIVAKHCVEVRERIIVTILNWTKQCLVSRYGVRHALLYRADLPRGHLWRPGRVQEAHRDNHRQARQLGPVGACKGEEAGYARRQQGPRVCDVFRDRV